jgi:hypothetical protein
VEGYADIHAVETNSAWFRGGRSANSLQVDEGVDETPIARKPVKIGVREAPPQFVFLRGPPDVGLRHAEEALRPWKDT